MRRNILCADVFIASPEARTELVYCAFEAVRDANVRLEKQLPLVFNTKHWTDLTNKIIPSNDTKQGVIDRELLRTCDLAIVLFGDKAGNENPDTHILWTEGEFYTLFKINDEKSRKIPIFVGISDVFSRKDVIDRLGSKVFYNKFETIKELRTLISGFLVDEANEIARQDAFLTMPITDNKEDASKAYLQESKEKLLQLYNDEHVLEFGPEKIAYSEFFPDKNPPTGDDLSDEFVKCKIIPTEYTARISEKSKIRHSILQNQMILKFIDWDKFHKNGALVRLTFEGGSLHMQKAHYYDQVVSNLALLWPLNETEWTGATGLSQKFGGALSSDRNIPLLGEPIANLHDLISKEEDSRGKLPPVNTLYLANTLGIGCICTINVGKKQYLLLREQPENAALFAGQLHLYSSFALGWPGDQTQDLWTHTKAACAQDIEKTIHNDYKKHADQPKQKTITLKKSFSVDVKPMKLLRELMRGGKPQLFVHCAITAIDNDLKRHLANWEHKVEIAYLDNFLSSRTLNIELAAALTIFKAQNEL